ncbi:hypothetical protein BD289DRAFT_417499 [Coniella lustricola]|uniref:FAD-binding domain-containing protein n=1 Tax=Coniella lustricola TaxID=2025994 RepID=A0A2T2ZV69_9PEZI|nr:hypothetical protein BD289DRAFT_417499 [Coniella lustricola]
MPHPNIAIVGAGPVGCTLARLLHVHCPSASVTIFEADTSPSYRSQGGCLDLHTATGLAALKEAGLMDEFLKYARYDGESLKIADKDLNIYIHVQPSTAPDSPGGHLGGQRPEIDRPLLRKLLADSLPHSWTRWGWKLKEVLPAADGAGARDARLTVSGFDLIVGAEGAWSKVRSVLSSTKPVYADLVYHELHLMDAETTAPDVYKAVNRGSLFVHSDGQKVTLQQQGDGSIVVCVYYLAEDDTWVFDKRRCGFDSADLDETKAALMEKVKDHHPLVREAIVKSTGRATARNFYMLPVGFQWPHRRGFTLIGDAAHVMTPFAGEGVNVGMEDALELLRAIKAAGEDADKLDANVAAFGAQLSVRAARYAQLTDGMRRAWFFTEDSPRAAMPKVLSMVARFHSPGVLKPLAALLGTGYGYYKGHYPDKISV